MRKIYKPTESKGFAWAVGIGLFCIALFTIPMFLGAKSGGPGMGFMGIMSVILVLVVMTIGYFGWAARKLEYRIEDDELVIDWGFHQKRIPLKDIIGVQKIIGNSSMKVVGASWPGFHWGSFTSPIGKGAVNLYATRIWGEITLIRTKWEDIGITPASTDEFLEDLTAEQPAIRAGSLPPFEGGRVFTPWKDRAFLGLVGVAVLIMAGTAIYLVSAIPGLPDRVPMHYNLAGEIDRYGSPMEIWTPFGIGALVNTFLIGFSLIVARNNKMSAYLMGAVTIFIALIFCLIAIGMVIGA